MFPRNLSRYSLALLSSAVIAACSSGDGTGTEGTIALSLNPPSATVQQGGQTQVTGTLTRGGGFTGTVNLTVTGAPTGVTATLGNIQTTGTVTTATITVLVSASAAVGGPHAITVRGTATGLTDATATFQLTITAAGSLTLGITPAGAVTLQQGTSNSDKTITITRTNVTAAVTLTAEGLPSGVTASFAGNPVSGNSSLMTLTATAGATAGGPVTVTIRGTAPSALPEVPSVQATVTFSLTVTAAGSFTLGITPAGAVTLQQGTSNSDKTITITRTNYTQPVTLTAEGLPAGVTASFAGNPVSGTSSVMTLTATAGATVGGPTTVTVRGTGPSALRGSGGAAAVEATTTFQLTITVLVVGNFTLTTTPATSVSVTQGASGNVTVNIVRTGGFTGSVALTVTGLVTGLTHGFNPASAPGASSMLTLTAAGNLAVGTYPIVIRGNFTGLAEQTVNLDVIVTAPGGSGNVTVDFSACTAASKPVWAAFQNGTGAWVVVTGVNDVYSFTIDAGKGGFTYVTLGTGGSSQVNVQYMTQAEWTAAAQNFCGAPATGRTLTGTIAGMGANDLGHVSFGNAQTIVPAALPNFTLNNAATGAHDLIIYTHPGATAVFDRMGIWRDENPTSSFGTRNIQTDPNSFLPLGALITITGAGPGETFTHGMNYYTGASCDFATLYLGMSVSGTQFNAYGAQTGFQRAGDRHGLTISGTTGTTMYRSVWESFHDLTARSVAMGSQVPAGTTTEEGTAYSILRNQYTAPTDFNSSFSWQYTQASAPKSALVIATYGFFAGINIDLKIGQYTGLTGWTPSWAPTAGLHADTYSTAVGVTPAGGTCSVATQRLIVAGRVGSF